MKQIDRIRNMNAEELAEEAANYFYNVVGEYAYSCSFMLREQERQLESEVKDDDKS